MRLTKAQAAELVEWQCELQADREQLEMEFGVLLQRIKEETASINYAIAKHNAKLALARAFVTRIAGDLRDDCEGKSERWQESDAGQAALAMAEAWEEAASLEDVAPVAVLLPDRPQWEEGLDLPKEPDA